jgi:peptidoglycan/xylan/chitin deacetylase (PgdA/CDA1 family)
VKSRGPRLATLGYHDVTADPRMSGFQRRSATAYKLLPESFHAHLDEISAAGVAPVTIGDVDLSGDEEHVLLTFDDGGKSAPYIAEELSRRGWRGHFFVVTSLIGTRAFVTAADLRAISDAGHVVGTHSHTHPTPFRALPLKRMLEEWTTSRDILADMLGRSCETGSVPGGAISGSVLRSGDLAGLRWLFTSEPRLTPRREGDCWILGRFIPKISTRPARIGRLVQMRGWGRAIVARRVRVLAASMLPAVYQVYRRVRDGEQMLADDRAGAHAG